MTVIQWDQVGDRRFEAGVDRGVLYLKDKAVPWNGLRSIEEIIGREAKSFYQDGIKYLDVQVLGEYAATLKAFTYPDEFDEVMGIANDGKGLYVHDQRPRPFNLAYRTRIGNDVDGVDHGYRLHLLYNLMAVPSNTAFASLTDHTDPTEFAWTISSTPSYIPNYRPTAHLSIKSTDIDAGYMEFIESLLYGTATSEPYLPSPTEMFDLVANRVTIVDNGDGTWTAQGSDRVVQDLGFGAYLLQGVQGTVEDDGDFTITIPAY